MPPKKQQKSGTSTPNQTAKGTATPVPNAEPEQTIVSSLPPYVGINFGNSYASIAVCSKDGENAECIANEDGERQIACAISFHGEEMYIGNQAKPQLVKNASNTIVGFRNLLGKKYSEIPESAKTTTISAPVIEHPSQSSEPAYKVKILQSAPQPLSNKLLSTFTSPAASVAPTPRSEPTPAERILTVAEVTSLFLGSLLQSAENFLGKKVLGAVISVPESFDDKAREALKKAANNAGVKVLQLLDESAAASVTTTSDTWNLTGVGEDEEKKNINKDRTQLLVDLGASSLSLSLLSIRDGLTHVLGSSTHEGIGGNQIDDKLIRFFAKEFTKKTKTALVVCPSESPADRRAEAKLRLAVEHTKRTLSASPGAATCSVESLKDGLDFTSSINRMRFDMEVRSIYESVLSAVRSLLSSPNVNLDPFLVNEIVYAGGSSCLPGLDETLVAGLSGDQDEESDGGVVTPFTAGTVVGGGTGDPTTILAKGCAVQAGMLAGLSGESNKQERGAFEEGRGRGVKVTPETIGVLFPDPKQGDDLGGLWIPVLLKETPIPARRTIAFEVGLNSETDGKFGFEIWEVVEGVRVEKRKVERPPVDDEEEEEEEEEEEIKHKTVEKRSCLGSISLAAKLGVKDKKTGTVKTTVEVEFLMGGEGALEVKVKEVGSDGVEGSLKIAAGS